MIFKDIPKHELDNGKYSERTISKLMATKQREYKAYIASSAIKHIPLLIGSYLAVCAWLAGYALSYGESIFVFNYIYLALAWLWLLFILMVPLQWHLRRPTVSDLIEEIGWYKEMVNINEGSITA